MKLQYEHTVKACFAGYIVQAIVNNFVQLLVDFLSAFFVDRIGYRISVLLAHGFAAAGILALPILPELFGNAFLGLLTAVIIYAVGGDFWYCYQPCSSLFSERQTGKFLPYCGRLFPLPMESCLRKCRLRRWLRRERAVLRWVNCSKQRHSGCFWF